MNGEVFCFDAGRSRKGAWIEIVMRICKSLCLLGRSRKGAWIEIETARKDRDKKQGRSRKGAWIEIRLYLPVRNISMVAPVRERGLKC